jgi:hypothetical protein
MPPRHPQFLGPIQALAPGQIAREPECDFRLDQQRGCQESGTRAGLAKTRDATAAPERLLARLIDKLIFQPAIGSPICRVSSSMIALASVAVTGLQPCGALARACRCARLDQEPSRIPDFRPFHASVLRFAASRLSFRFTISDCAISAPVNNRKFTGTFSPIGW